MLIGLVVPAAPTYSETFFRNKVRVLAEAGIRTIVFTNSAKTQSSDLEIVHGFTWEGGPVAKILELAKACLMLARAPVTAVRLFRLNRRDRITLKNNIVALVTSAHVLIHRVDWLHFGYATTSLGKENLARAIGAQMGVSIRGYDIGVYPVKKPGCYQLLWQRTDKLHYISDDLYALALKEGFDRRRPHQKIRPAIDTSLFEPKVCGPQSPPRPIKILTVARLHWKKGLEYTLQALAILKSRKIDFLYTIIGDGPERDRLVFACHQLGITENVKFVGALSSAETIRSYKEAAIYLQYSIQEGFCNAVLEAQASGLPCIVSDAEGLAENVLDGQTGWVVPKRNPKLLAEKIQEVIGHPEQMLEKSQTATIRTPAEFSLERQKRDFLHFYGIDRSALIP